MNNFERSRQSDYAESKAKEICEGKDGQGGVFDKLDTLVTDIRYARGIRPYCLEDFLDHEVTLREKTPRDYSFLERKVAMHIYRVTINAIYARYGVDLAKSIAHIEFHSVVSEPHPTKFMGVLAIGHYDEGEIEMKVEHFSGKGIGFVERHRYTKKGNIGIGVISTPGHLAYVGHPYADDLESDHAVPYDFSLSAYEIVNGRINDCLY